jgi:hypothetical protein
VNDDRDLFVCGFFAAAVFILVLLLASMVEAKPPTKLVWMNKISAAREPGETKEQRYRRLLEAERAILRHTRGDKELTAAVFVIGEGETHFGKRFAEDGCLPNECDKGQSKGYFQNKRMGCPELWDAPTDVDIMAGCATRLMKHFRRLCRGDLAGAFSLYAGLPCSHPRGQIRAARVQRLLGAN